MLVYGRAGVKMRCMPSLAVLWSVSAVPWPISMPQSSDKKIFIDWHYYLFMMLSCTVNNRISQIFNLITQKSLKLINIIRIWYVIKNNEKSKQKLLDVFFVCPKLIVLRGYSLWTTQLMNYSLKTYCSMQNCRSYSKLVASAFC